MLATGSELAAELDRLGVRFVRCDPGAPHARRLSAEELLVGLVSSPEERLRLAIIPLMLWRPDLSANVAEANGRLGTAVRATFACYYAAAWLLQSRFEPVLATLRGAGVDLLPPAQLGLDIDEPWTGDPLADLPRVAARHDRLTGGGIDWLGTYEHAVTTFVARARRQAA